VPYPKGRQGQNQRVVERRAKELLKDLIANKNSAERLARISEELRRHWAYGYTSAWKWHSREQSDPPASRADNRADNGR
jgi:hypothetical protein